MGPQQTNQQAIVPALSEQERTLARQLAEDLAYALHQTIAQTITAPGLGADEVILTSESCRCVIPADLGPIICMLWWYRTRPKSWGLYALQETSAEEPVLLLRWYTDEFPVDAIFRCPHHPPCASRGHACPTRYRFFLFAQDAHGRSLVDEHQPPAWLTTIHAALEREQSNQDERERERLGVGGAAALAPPSSQSGRLITTPPPADLGGLAERYAHLAESAVPPTTGAAEPPQLANLVAYFEAMRQEREREFAAAREALGRCQNCFFEAHPELRAAVEGGHVAIEAFLQRWFAGTLPMPQTSSSQADDELLGRERAQHTLAREHWTARETALARADLLRAKLCDLCLALYGAHAVTLHPPGSGEREPRPVCARCDAPLPANSVPLSGSGPAQSSPVLAAAHRRPDETNSTGWIN